MVAFRPADGGRVERGLWSGRSFFYLEEDDKINMTYSCRVCFGMI